MSTNQILNNSGFKAVENAIDFEKFCTFSNDFNSLVNDRVHYPECTLVVEKVLNRRAVCKLTSSRLGKVFVVISTGVVAIADYSSFIYYIRCVFSTKH